MSEVCLLNRSTGPGYWQHLCLGTCCRARLRVVLYVMEPSQEHRWVLSPFYGRRNRPRDRRCETMCPWGADPKSQTAALGFALTGLERVLFLLLHCLQLMSNKTLRVSQAACWRPTVNNSGPFHHPLSLFPDFEATEEARHKSGLSSALVTSVCRCSTPHPAVFPSRASKSPSRVGPASGLDPSPGPRPWPCTSIYSRAHSFQASHCPFPAQVALFWG